MNDTVAKRSPADMVAMYIRLRDHKKAAEDEFKKSMARVNEGMDKLEGEMLEHLNQSGANSLSCESGTAYKSRKTSVTVQEEEVFLEYVRANDLWAALDVKANKTFVQKRMDEEEEIPPGLKITQVDIVGVRRS